MAKRRRERDRPKAAHYALYNPNKRVMLSYASSDESADEEFHGTGDDRQLANYEIEPYPEDEHDDEQHAPGLDGQMPVGSSEDVDIEDGEISANAEYEEVEQNNVIEQSIENKSNVEKNDGKRANGKNTDGRSAFSKGAARQKDPDTNQWLSFGYNEDADMGNGQDDELEIDDMGDVMAYLRSVRTERHGIPSILSALPADVSDEADDETTLSGGDARYHDGVFAETAKQEPKPDLKSEEIGPVACYTNKLVKRFLGLRERLRRPVPQEEVNRLDIHHPINVYRRKSSRGNRWLDYHPFNTPHLAQVGSLTEDTVYRMLALLKRRSFQFRENIDRNTSMWIFVLLAKLKEVDLMTNDDIWPLRELAKEAILLALSFSNPVIAKQIADLQREGKISSDDDEGFDDSISQAYYVEGDDLDGELQEKIQYKTKQVVNPDEILLEGCTSDVDETPVEADSTDSDAVTEPSENTTATIDMIITIVGEVYRQRDILEQRPKVWVRVDESGMSGTAG